MELGEGNVTVVPIIIGGNGEEMLACWVSVCVTNIKSNVVDVTETVADAGPSLQRH